MKLNLNKRCSFSEKDCHVGREHIGEVIDWLFAHNEKEYKKVGIRQGLFEKSIPTGEEKMCLVCKELGLLQEKTLTKAQEKAVAKELAKEQAMERAIDAVVSKEEPCIEMEAV